MSSFQNVLIKIYFQIIYLIYMYKQDLVLNNPQWSICHKTQPNPNPTQTNRGWTIFEDKSGHFIIYQNSDGENSEDTLSGYYQHVYYLFTVN